MNTNKIKIAVNNWISQDGWNKTSFRPLADAIVDIYDDIKKAYCDFGDLNDLLADADKTGQYNRIDLLQQWTSENETRLRIVEAVEGSLFIGRKREQNFAHRHCDILTGALKLAIDSTDKVHAGKTRLSEGVSKPNKMTYVFGRNCWK